MVGNYGRRLLRINLSTKAINEEIIPEEYLRKFIGGRALGAMLLYDEVAPGVEPLAPDNKLIFSTGPLCATSVPGNAKYVVHTKSPQTGIYLVSLSSGHFGPQLKRTGHDVLIVEGKSEKPVYLVISDDSVKIRDASHLWGMTTDYTQEFIKSELGSERFSVACIGPAGENLVLFACIMNGRRAAGRGGAGAVMGSKNLKAIAIRGAKEVDVAHPQALKEGVKQAINEVMSHPATKAFLLYGSTRHIAETNEQGVMPFRNWQEACSPKAEAIYPEHLRSQYLVIDGRCAPPCPLKCAKITLVREGVHAGALTEGPQYEASYALGSCCDITDWAAIIDANSLCNKYGLDLISMGVSLAFAMECCEKGIVSAEITRGEEIKFGDSILMLKLIRDTAYRRGFGSILSLGSKRMSELFGRGSDAFAMQVKGLEMGGYDPRGVKSMALVFACGPRGGCHHAGGYTALAEGAMGPEIRLSEKNKGPIVKRSREQKVVEDSAVLCTFIRFRISIAVQAKLLSASLGYDISPDDLNAIGERGSNVERAFNVRQGLRRSSDTLPARLLKESPLHGPTAGQVVELEPMLNDFYAVCGWDIKTGIPTQQKLNELGLQRIAEDLRQLGLATFLNSRT